MKRSNLLAALTLPMLVAAQESAFGAPRRVVKVSPDPQKPKGLPRDREKILSSLQLYTFNINGVTIQAHSKKDAKKIYNRKYKK